VRLLDPARQPATRCFDLERIFLTSAGHHADRDSRGGEGPTQGNSSPLSFLIPLSRGDFSDWPGMVPRACLPLKLTQRF
jgi:hypothetical protein